MVVKQALQNYLQSAMRMAGADGASLCLPAETGEGSCVLLHAGEPAPLPELADEQAATAYCQPASSAPVAENASRKPILYFLPSKISGGYMMGISIEQIRHRSMLTGSDSALDRRADRGGEKNVDDGPDKVVWLGLRYTESAPPAFIQSLCASRRGVVDFLPGSEDEGLTRALALGGYMAWEAYGLSRLQQDSISNLPGRTEFQACLKREYATAVRDDAPLGLILVNPDEFGLINHRLGQHAGDAALRELALRLSKNLRRSDQVFRYGGAVFVVLMPDTSLPAVNTVAEKLRRTLTQHSYIDGAANFTFSLGAAVNDPSAAALTVPEDPDELLRRADQALNVAKLSGGGQTIVWQQDGSHSMAENLDRLSGIFTADTEKDYRNMLLLWDTITVISSGADTEDIAREFVDRIGATFKPVQVALFINNESQELVPLAANLQQPDGLDRVSNRDQLSPTAAQYQLLREAEKHHRTERLRFNQDRSGTGVDGRGLTIAFAIPLLARGDCFGCLYLDGPEAVLTLDTSDLMFLDALTSQIAVALDRAALIDRWKQEQERESRRLRQEVKELRQAIQHGRLVYQSDPMEQVVTTLRKVAPTDITVLITGESGTGKEMLARSLHEMSARQERPFVTVDCGAIAHSLMDTELFGHLKGAYTGAQGTAPGRIAEAEGGTLFLDEIGEIPLEIQAKLLRFLQEKEITPVGGTRPASVDARIVAATNRDLADEVAAGRFRADLYYRLRVISVVAPPLRERRDDVLPLARHFLERFTLDYGKNGLSFDGTAEAALQGYHWPGNVRELQHRVLQAVVMSEQDRLGPRELGLAAAGCTETEENGIPPVNRVAEPIVVKAPSGRAADSSDPRDAAVATPWSELRNALKDQVTTVLSNGNIPLPLGRWLADDLVLAADQETNNVIRQACLALGMPETTYRRRLEKVKRELNAGLNVRNSDWSNIPPILTALIADSASPSGGKLFDRARSVLLEEVVARVRTDNAKGSALMGVTAPTYRRWIASM